MEFHLVPNGEHLNAYLLYEPQSCNFLDKHVTPERVKLPDPEQLWLGAKRREKYLKRRAKLLSRKPKGELTPIRQ